ncbi:uncharacterized protein LOC135085133 [Ostrinia nubilalis]|uniref:uncharacterized protein LOC135085133 n=1 Tax=Ostrinia nubilalis TaxID=29057 RepID=UPI0030826B9C
MQRNDRWPEDYDPDGSRSRPGSRRNSASLSRRSSAKKEKEGKKKSPSNTPSSASSTPKKVVKPQNLEFMVTGKQCLKKCDRANSLPGYNRRTMSSDAKTKKLFESPKRTANASQSSKSRETSLEDDMSLDLSQVSDFEDTNSKYGIKTKFQALATSTPKAQKAKPRSGSLQSHLAKEVRKPRFERDSTFSCSRESVFKSSSSASPYKYGANTTELDYSSVSPEYSGQSSNEMSPRVGGEVATPRSIEPHLSSCCGSSWQDCSEAERTAVDRDSGEWSEFWANYNNSVARVPVKSYYDQCPTPYRTENIDLADLEFSTEGSRKRSPDNIDHINYVIRNEGLHLTPRETQNMIKCAHILGNVLTKAIERRCKEKDQVDDRVQEVKVENEDPEIENKKKTLTLDLKETNEPAVVEEEKRCETVTTQTDISLPNTKSAPRIFEKILRQLSKSSLDEGIKAMNISMSENESKVLENTEVKEESNQLEVKKD